MSCLDSANYVVLKHGDGTMTTYRHLNRVDVKRNAYYLSRYASGYYGGYGYYGAVYSRYSTGGRPGGDGRSEKL